ncbi:MAG TPA: Slp family lipoprotein [Nitrospiria bacterium]|nr:Slp family lipoprotein [Nitrospiria bacterium]
MRYPFIMTWLATSLLIGGCVNYYAIPESFDKQIDRSVTFADLKRDPEAYKGKVLALGGVVLRAKNLKDGTQIEVLQLPLDSSDRPDYPLEASQGRFMILDPEHHDPAVLKDRRITVVAEIVGKKVDLIDEFEYTFPYASARFVYIWSERRGYGYSSPYDYYSYPYYYYYPDPFLYGYSYGYPPWYFGAPFIGPPSAPQPGRRFDGPSGQESPPPESPGGGSRRSFGDKKN